jgi:glycosyltransferase involved in cell wall biosynthesis
MRILVATDAWHPQVNGVVRTLTMMAEAASAFGVEVSFLTPLSFRTVAMPSYPDLRLALPGRAKIARMIAEARPDSIHIATEGPIGLSVRRYCRQQKLPFTTSFHTRFPEYISARLPIPESWIWAALRWFHGASRAVMAATPALATELRMRGFRNVVLWPRGVDTTQFHPRAGAELGLPRPVFLCVGRVAVEKNLEAFLGLDLPGTKVVVGDGPALTALARKYPRAVFLGATGRAIGGNLCGCRRLCVSKQNRHFWSRSPRSSRQRLAGRGFSGDRSPRRDRCGAGRRVERRSAAGMPVRAGNFAASLPRLCRWTCLGGFGAGFCRQLNRRPRARSKKRCVTFRRKTPASGRLI